MLKEHFEGIQKALTTEIKEMKAIFDELEAKVDQNAVNRKCDETEQKNILIANDTLIANCLSKEVFYLATNSDLNVSRFSEMHDAHTLVQARCLKLESELSKLKDKIQKDDHDVMITQLTEKVSVLQEQNELFRVENAKVKQHYKELYDSIKITHSVTPKVLAPGMYAINVEPIPPRLRNNREIHLDYLKHLKKSVETLREIVEEVKVERPLDRSLASAYLYTKHSQELLEYMIGTCPKDFNKRDKKQATTLLNRKKQVTFADKCETSNTNTQNISNPRRNTKKNRISPAKSVNRKTVKDHSRTNKSNLQKPNHADSSISSKRTVINSNSDFVCQTCNKCFILANHDMCVIKYLNSMNALSSAKNVVRKVKQVWKPKHVKQVWKATGKVLTTVGYQWKPTGRIFTLGEQCPLTRFTQTKVVLAKQPENVSTSKIVVTENLSYTSQKPLTRYQGRKKLNKVVSADIPTPIDT
nr:hypothetical protein [Tanacetum cinerariifolium]